jgi:hypothetical protein
MTKPLSRRELERLAKLCGMFGSDHAGERAAAAAKADALLRHLGVTWHELIAPTHRPLIAPPTRPASVAAKIALLRQRAGLLNRWERDFLASLNGFRRLSPKQCAIVDDLFERISERAA